MHCAKQSQGGSLPSPHCAGTTIMLVMLYRYNRKAFYVLLPTLLSVYFATVYGRFHYAWDGIAGILVAMVMVRSTPRVAGWIESLRVHKASLDALLFAWKLRTRFHAQAE